MPAGVDVAALDRERILLDPRRGSRPNASARRRSAAANPCSSGGEVASKFAARGSAGIGVAQRAKYLVSSLTKYFGRPESLLFHRETDKIPQVRIPVAVKLPPHFQPHGILGPCGRRAALGCH